MRSATFYLRNALEPDRIDRVVVEAGAVLVDTQATGKHSPLINISQLVRVELLHDDAEQAEADETATPTPDPRTHGTQVPSAPVSVPDADPVTPFRWDAYFAEEPPDAA